MTGLPPGLERIPQICLWEITLECNLRCIHCISRAGSPLSDELSTAEALDLADQLARAGCRTVCLTGGEPLLREDWPAIARRLCDRGVEVNLATNGVLLDERTVAQLLKSGVSGVGVSLDGKKKVHDRIRRPGKGRGGAGSSYDAVLQGLEQIVASPLSSAVVTQIHKQNIGDLEEMYELLARMGVQVWQLQIAIPAGRLTDIESEYLIHQEQIPGLIAGIAALVDDGRVTLMIGDNIGYYDRHEPVIRGSGSERHGFWTGCRAGLSSVGLCANGDVVGCLSMPRSFVTGNIRQRHFVDIWNDEENFSYNTAWQEELLEGQCASCAHLRLCRAGCTSTAFALTGTIYNNPFCALRTSSEG